VVMPADSWMVRFRLLPKTEGYPPGTPAEASGTTVALPLRMLANAPDSVLRSWFEAKRNDPSFPDNLVCVTGDILTVLAKQPKEYGYRSTKHPIRVSCYRLWKGHILTDTFTPREWRGVRAAIYNCAKRGL
jgi:hypothetical protein